MTTKPSFFSKLSFLSFVLVLLSASTTFAGYVADSDMSNVAGSNIGRNQTGMYVFICLLLVLSVYVAYRKKPVK